MGIKTAIEYADSTINPVMGCTGCELLDDHCYAHRLCRRYAGGKGWPKEFTEPEHFPDRLEKALKWKDLTGMKRPDKPWLDGMPRVIFVNDLSDGFCPDGVDADEWLAPHVVNMANSPHIWLLLTKWPNRMRSWMDKMPWVPHNFWLGTTVMRQSDEWRVEELLSIERVRGKRWVSLEPLLGKVDVRLYQPPPEQTKKAKFKGTISLIVVGGETGPGARPIHPAWARKLRDQCQVAHVSYFFKQWGEWGPNTLVSHIEERMSERRMHRFLDGACVHRYGQKLTGRLLDGVEYNEMPEVTNE